MHRLPLFENFNINESRTRAKIDINGVHYPSDMLRVLRDNKDKLALFVAYDHDRGYGFVTTIKHKDKDKKKLDYDVYVKDGGNGKLVGPVNGAYAITIGSSSELYGRGYPNKDVEAATTWLLRDINRRYATITAGDLLGYINSSNHLMIYIENYVTNLSYRIIEKLEVTDEIVYVYLQREPVWVVDKSKIPASPIRVVDLDDTESEPDKYKYYKNIEYTMFADGINSVNDAIDAIDNYEGIVCRPVKKGDMYLLIDDSNGGEILALYYPDIETVYMAVLGHDRLAKNG